MTLLLNYRPVIKNPTGIGTYAHAVLPALQDLPHLLVPGGERGTAKQRLKRLVWTQLELQRIAERHKASLVFTPAPEGYLGPQRIPQVVMVHDLRPISHPERSLQSIYFRSWVPPLLRQCRHVLTNSQFTAREIQRCAGVPDSHLTVIPLGYDERLFRSDPSGQLSCTEACRSASRPYLLHLGQAYPHKNLSRLIRAFAVVAPRYPLLRLVLVGKTHPRESPKLRLLVRDLGLLDRVEFRSYVPLEELPDLYRGALAMVFPSLWEGFGLPVLEAMACGTPVITSFGSGTQEVAGDAALLVNPLDEKTLASSMAEVVEDAQLRERLRCRGLERSKRFSWGRTGSQTAELLQALM